MLILMLLVVRTIMLVVRNTWLKASNNMFDSTTSPTIKKIGIINSNSKIADDTPILSVLREYQYC